MQLVADTVGDVGAVVQHPGDVLRAEEGGNQNPGHALRVGADPQLPGDLGPVEELGDQVGVIHIGKRETGVDEMPLYLEAGPGLDHFVVPEGDRGAGEDLDDGFQRRRTASATAGHRV
jgi:hypothetical protein